MSHDSRPLSAPKNPEPRKTMGRALLVTIAACALPLPLLAAKTEITPRIDVGAIHETNPRLSRQVEDEATGLIVEGLARVNWSSRKNEVEFEPRFRIWRYDDANDSDLENNDGWLPLEWTYTGQRSQASALIEYSDVGVRTTELESADSGPGGGSTNIGFADDTRRQWRFEPRWTLQATQRDAFTVSLAYLDTEFSEKRANRLDFTYLGGTVSWQHSITPKLALGVEGLVSQFESESAVAKSDPEDNQGLATDNDTTTYRGSAFVNYQFSETLSGSVYFGGSGTDAEVTVNPFLDISGTPFCITSEQTIGAPPCSDEFSNEAYTGSASLQKTGERTQYNASISREIIPTARGAETLRDELRIRARHSFSRKLSGDVGLLWFNEDIAAAADGTRFEREYLSFNVNLEWRFAQYFGLRGAYRYVEVDNSQNLSVDRQNSTDNNYFFVGMFYGGQGWRL